MVSHIPWPFAGLAALISSINHPSHVRHTRCLYRPYLYSPAHLSDPTDAFAPFFAASASHSTSYIPLVRRRSLDDRNFPPIDRLSMYPPESLCAPSKTGAARSASLACLFVAAVLGLPPNAADKARYQVWLAPPSRSSMSKSGLLKKA